jgi:hypothetical protein
MTFAWLRHAAAAPPSAIRPPPDRLRRRISTAELFLDCDKCVLPEPLVKAKYSENQFEPPHQWLLWLWCPCVFVQSDARNISWVRNWVKDKWSLTRICCPGIGQPYEATLLFLWSFNFFTLNCIWACSKVLFMSDLPCWRPQLRHVADHFLIWVPESWNLTVLSSLIFSLNENIALKNMFVCMSEYQSDGSPFEWPSYRPKCINFSNWIS